MLTTTTNDMKSITPDQIAQLITLPVQAASVAAQVASLLSTSSTRTQLPIIAADPSAAWVAEGAEIGASDPTVDDIVVTPSKIAGLTIITNELAADTSPAAAGIVGDGLARDIALKIDAAFFGSKGASLIQPAGLEDLAGVSLVDAGVAWANLDPFAEAIANAEGLGLMVDSFIANPADALLLAQLKESSGSNKPLLGSDPSSPTRRILQGARLFTSPGVTVGTVWGIPQVRAVMVRREGVELAVDRSAYFTSDRTAIRATMRVGFGFPHAVAIQKIALTA
jgi:HK97 family phage major capsid protein